MMSEKIYRWKTDEVTIYVKKLLQEARQIKADEVLNLGVGTKDLEKTFLYLKGYMDGLDLFLEAELEETNDEKDV